MIVNALVTLDFSLKDFKHCRLPILLMGTKSCKFFSSDLSYLKRKYLQPIMIPSSVNHNDVLTNY